MSEPLSDRALEKLLADARPLAEGVQGGTRSGKYLLVRELGRGGMGVVWEAQDLELGRRVALKLLAPAVVGDATARARFVREARAAARLTHPGIAAVYDADGERIAMQLVEGEPLSRARPADMRESVRLLRDAALAVDHANSQGVVHRDLKPHNLLVERGRVVVTDFGLAKDAAELGELSLSGNLLGTPAYMAPEQAAGRGRAVDARTDVYGLAATLYDLLAGRPPFAEREVVQLLRAVVEDEPEALPHGVPRDLALIVRKGLAKEPERRYATAGELARDLDRWLAGEAVLARAPSFSYRMSKFARRRRALLALGAAVLIALAIAGLATWSERAQRSASAEALELSQRAASVLADAEMHRRLGDMETAGARLDEGIATAQALLARRDVAQGWALLGRLLRARGRTSEARAALDRAIELEPEMFDARLERGLFLAGEVALIASRASPPIHVDDPERMDPALRAERELAIADLRAAQERAPMLRDVDRAFARAELARLFGDRAAARKDLEEVLRLAPAHSEARLALSQLELAEGNADTAWHLAMSAVDLYRGFGPAYVARSHAGVSAASAPGALEEVVRRHELSGAELRIRGGEQTSETYQLRGGARLSIDDVEGALADFAAAVQVDPSDAMAHANRGLVHTRRAARLATQGQSEQALVAWQQAIDDYLSARTLDPSLAGADNNRGICHLERERLLGELDRGAEAAQELERALAAFGEAIATAPRFGLAFQNRGVARRRATEVLARTGEPGDALALCAQAKADLDRALELKPLDGAALCERALASQVLARIHAARGSAAELDDALLAARADFEAAALSEPRSARVRGLRGVFLAEAGDAEEARAELEAALALAPDARLRRAIERALAQLTERERPPSR